MLINRFQDRVYFKSELLGSIPHAFTTKCGGFSRWRIEGLNLGFRCGDDAENVRKNYQAVAEDLNMPYNSIVAARQTHSVNIRVVTEEDKGKGVSRDSDIADTDGLITNCKGIPLVVFYADCVPILLADEKKTVVAAVHSGWRGTVQKIAQRAVGMMCDNFGCRTEDIKAVIGPSIGPCCFEVGGEVAQHFDEEFVRTLNNGKFTVDLWRTNQNILMQSGVLTENIEVFEKCTMCNNDKLYSYRSHGENTGRMGALIML